MLTEDNMFLKTDKNGNICLWLYVDNSFPKTYSFYQNIFMKKSYHTKCESPLQTASSKGNTNIIWYQKHNNIFCLEFLKKKKKQTAWASQTDSAWGKHLPCTFLDQMYKVWQNSKIIFFWDKVFLFENISFAYIIIYYSLYDWESGPFNGSDALYVSTYSKCRIHLYYE